MIAVEVMKPRKEHCMNESLLNEREREEKEAPFGACNTFYAVSCRFD